jgi:hypothetical protein
MLGAGTGDQGGRDGGSVCGHARQDRGHIGDIGQHDRVGDEVDVSELLLLLDGIATLDHWATERNPVEELVVGLDLGGFGADDAADFCVGDVAQQEQRALDPAELAERAVEQAATVVCAELA